MFTEAPTIFYAIMLGLAVLSESHDSTTVRLGWAYVGLRSIHSLVHSLYNPIRYRFLLYSMSEVVKLVLGYKLAVLAFA